MTRVSTLWHVVAVFEVFLLLNGIDNILLHEGKYRAAPFPGLSCSGH